MLSQNLTKKYINYLLFMGLWTFCHQHQTFEKPECQNDLFKTAKEMLESAPNAIFEKHLAADGIDGISITKWVQKYSGFLCCKNFEAKIKTDEQNNTDVEKFFKNLKMIQNLFCKKLNDGKGMQEAAKKVENIAIKLLIETRIGKSSIKQIIQKFFGEKRQTIEKELKKTSITIKSGEKIVKLLKYFNAELFLFFDAIKANKLSCDQRTNRNSIQRKRQKRSQRGTFQIQHGGTTSTNNTTGTRTASSGKCAFVLVMAAISILVFIYPMYSFLNNKLDGVSIGLFAISLIGFFVNAFLFLYFKCGPYYIGMTEH
ncbi:hypothetical protein GPALN_014380 [Globodera pallida]|nr:hypothetical protein GPALN_014380 [Globodera pallida]